MEIAKFVEVLESKYGPCYRKISVFIDENGKKKMYPGFYDKNDATQDFIKNNRGLWKDGGENNTFSIHNRVMKNFYTLDFDSKCEKAMNSKLKQLLDSKNTYHTETQHGFHYYVEMPDFPWEEGVKYDALKIGNEGFEIDLLKNNCSWEYNDRKVEGDNISVLEWENTVSKYFNVVAMNIRPANEKKKKKKKSPKSPKTPPKTPPNEDDEEQVVKCSDEEFLAYLDRLGPHRYKYEDWVKVGMVCHTNFDGDTKGFAIWLDWSGEDEDGEPDMNDMFSKYKGFSDYDGDVLTYKTIRKWAGEDDPDKNQYKDACLNRGQDKMIDLINEELAYCVSTSEYIHQYKENWYPKKYGEMDSYFSRFRWWDFSGKKPVQINPFKLWCDNINQHRVDKIVFDPQETERSKSCFNLWKGYKIPSESCQDADIDDCNLILKHIKTIWCPDDVRQYNYILDWFASKLQQPWKKLCSVPVFQSKEGAGKNIILDIFYKIMGNEYFMGISNPLHILGSFNGMVEGKLLVDLNEVSFGGNIQQNNQLKSLITEDQTIVNKKNKESYNITNLCDYIITTNCEWAISVGSDNRRYNCFEMSNWLAGNNDDCPEKTEYTKKLLEQTTSEKSIKAFAKFLYERDISGFNPRLFKRTSALKYQVEQGWNPIIKWIHSSLENNSMNIKLKCKWNDFCPPNGFDSPQLGLTVGNKFYYYKDELYRLFNEGSGHDKHNNLSKFCSGLKDVFKSQFLEMSYKGKTVIRLPDIDEAKKCFREHQVCDDYFNEEKYPELVVDEGDKICYEDNHSSSDESDCE